MNSRLKLSWCKHAKPCGDPETVCRDMDSDIAASYRLAREYPGQIHLLRYEDLSLDPQKHTKALYQFLELPILGHIKSYVDRHTSANVVGRHSTVHDSKSHVFLWRHQIPWRFLTEIQRHCAMAFGGFGYKRIRSLSEKSLNNSLLTKTDEEIWSYGIESGGTW